MVLPYGSRVATSRINFRLLSRDALTHEKRLSIVAGDPGDRALAASAGLPVFASVAEYESSLAGLENEESPARGRGAAAVVAADSGPDGAGRAGRRRHTGSRRARSGGRCGDGRLGTRHIHG